MAVPYTFANATVSIPLSQLDSNFATAITLGNTAIQLGNTVTTLNNMTLANVTVSSGNATFTTANVTNMSSSNVTITGGTIANVTISGSGSNITTTNINASNVTVSTDLTLSGGTANGVSYLNGSKVLTTGSALTFDGSTLSSTKFAGALNGTVGATTPNTGKFTTAEVTTNVTFPDASTQNTAATGFGFKNRIINGAMMIDQRNAGASVTINASAVTYTLDRWFTYGQATDGVFTVQQAGTGLAGFPQGLKVTVTTADASIGASQSYFIGQYIEGFNTADLAWGTASAKTVTLSFWVYSSVTGTLSGSLRNSAVNRSYPFTYTVNSANTWEQKTITIAGDTTGTWVGATNGVGLGVVFSLGGGSTVSGTAGSWSASNFTNATGAVNPIATLNATIYFTGVQLEVGSTATSFDYRPYGTELALCKRYFQLGGGLGACYQGGATATFTFQAKMEPQMRAAPSTITIQNGTTAVVQNGRAYANINSISLVINSTPQSVYMTVVSADTGMTANYSGEVSGQAIAYSAEL